MNSPTVVMVLGLCVLHASAQEALHIDVLEGQHAVVAAAGGRGANFRVRVLDDEKQPVKGAVVSAVLPPMGVGGHFRGGNTIATTETDSDGEAQFTGIRLRNLTGDFTTRILARQGKLSGTTQVVQKVSASTEPDKGWLSRRRLVMMSVAGAGVAAGMFVAFQGAGATVVPAGPTVTTGTPIITSPR